MSQYLSQLQELAPEQLQPYITRSNLQIVLRAVVLVSTVILFWPHLQSLFRTVSGQPDPRSAEAQARLTALQEAKKGNPSLLNAMAAQDNAQKNKAKARKGGGKVVKMVVPDGKGGIK